MTLEQLAIRYNCDKFHSHSYIPFYADLFLSMNIKRLLEIGIGFRELMEPFIDGPYIHGASLKMFRDYLPGASIFGCDIREDVLFFEDRIFTYPCDQSNPSALLRMMTCFGGKFDVIIDDGSHQTPHQIISAQTLLPFVNEGGVYVIEDCSEPQRIVSELGEGEIHEFGKRADDTLVVIRR